MYKTKITKDLNINPVDLDSISTLEVAFSRMGYDLFLVGGYVRDLVLERTPHDIDLCTNATPDTMKEIVKSFNDFNGDQRFSTWDTGIKFGTITITDYKNKTAYEVTSYRIDGAYKDGRHPEEIIIDPSKVTLEKDLERRDFTINSFALSLKDKELLMLDEAFLVDAKLGVIRCVGNPYDRFQEDALRMLRAIRFSAQLGFSIEEETYKAIWACGPLLKKISKERIRIELTKIILSDNPQKLELLAMTDIEQYLWDSTDESEYYIKKMLEESQKNRYHYTDVFHHTMDVIKQLPKDFVVRWAAFFHDIGKPYDKTVDEEGWEHYYHHPEKSAVIADRIMETLKFTNEQKEVIHKFVKHHDYPLSKVNNSKFKNMIVIIGEENFPSFLNLRAADAAAHRLSVSADFAITAVSICKERFTQLLLCPEPLRVKDLDINGEDLKAYGLIGKAIGDALHLCLDFVLEDPGRNKKEILLAYLKSIDFIK